MFGEIFTRSDISSYMNSNPYKLYSIIKKDLDETNHLVYKV